MFEGCTIKYFKDTMTNENGISRAKSVPLKEDNTDYQNILAWVAEGNTIQEAD